ncbi:conserved hypothetical protein [Cupriavidus sp. YR651]|uniref:DUF2459 domain-containing protein n=1 Tax=Cupriavidus sp. YR651 TaxID=1855315 RepID=UPI00088D090E|nr:DUF2459 domain-containing protein [Cupriavidus sp. YR651]SDD92036.1 conserved hypothetical protein [Cupriavidus sp. YR651]
MRAHLSAYLSVACLAGCVSSPAAAPAAAPEPPVETTIDVVEREWHTDVCIRTEDAGARLMPLLKGYDGSRFLCFGFGDRHYLVSRERGPMTLLSALLPGEGAILLTILRDTPAAAFSADNVVRLRISQAGSMRLQAFLGDAVQLDGSGAPVRLGDGPYEGGLYFGATATYAGFYTCNTWTAQALRTAGVPVYGPVLFAEGVMRQVREAAAAQPAQTAP